MSYIKKYFLNFNHLPFYLLFITLIPIFSVISEDVILKDDISQYPLGKNLAYYVDKTNRLSFEEISKPGFAPQFIQSKVYNQGFGIQESIFWVRLSFQNSGTKKSKFYLEEAFPPIDYIEMFIPEDFLLPSVVIGDSFPFKQRIVNHRNPIFPIIIPPGNSKTIYLKFKTKSAMVFRLSLHDEESLFFKTSMEQFFFGIFYGIILVMLITNLFLFLFLKEKLYIYYVAYTFALGMYFLVFNGFGFAYFWSESTYWNDIANPIFLTLALLTGTRTAIHFLKISEYSTTIHDILDALSILTILNIFFVFIFPYQYSLYYLYILIGPIAIVIFIGAILSLFQRNPLAKFFLLGFIGFILCGISVAMNNLGIIESYVSPDLLQVASGVGLVILSIGLGHRYFILRQQNVEIETKSLLINSRLNKIQNELELSKKIHESLLPVKLPELKNARMYAKYLPSGEIGGDFYDFHFSEGIHLGIFIADVTGHGVPAALFASTVKFSFSRETEFLKHPAKLLANINSSLFERIGNNFLSAGYLYLDLKNRRIIYASCGHPPLLIWKKEEKEFIELKPKGRLIGISPDIILHDLIYKLEIGDRILFYTDGLVECENTEGIPFGEKDLRKFTLQNEDLTAEEYSNALVNTLNGYSATYGRFNDDVTFIVIDII